MLTKSVPTMAQGMSGTSWGITVSRCWLVAWLWHIEHADMYSLRSAFMLGQNNIPSFGVNTPRYPGVMSGLAVWAPVSCIWRLARHEREGRLVLTVHLDTGSKVPPDVVDLSMITSHSCWRCSSEDVYSLIYCKRCAVIGKYCTMLMCSRLSCGPFTWLVDGKEGDRLSAR